MGDDNDQIFNDIRFQISAFTFNNRRRFWSETHHAVFVPGDLAVTLTSFAPGSEYGTYLVTPVQGSFFVPFRHSPLAGRLFSGTLHALNQ
jgi:hypothetical protein